MTMPSLASELLFTITVYTVLWAGFGTMHSLLASLWAKRLFGLSPATHRKVYNISATFVLAPILYYSYPGVLLLFRDLLLQQLLIIPLIQFLLALLFLTLAVLLLMETPAPKIFEKLKAPPHNRFLNEYMCLQPLRKPSNS